MGAVRESCKTALSAGREFSLFIQSHTHTSRSPTSNLAITPATGTKIFASNMNAAMAQRFYGLVLLPRVRADIQEAKRLNYHLYQALRKAIYKPAAFFKGIILPLCEGAAEKHSLSQWPF